MTSGFSAAGCAVQSKSSSVFRAGKLAWRTYPRAGGVAREHLGFEQRLEKLLVWPLLGSRALCCLLEPLQHPWCFQLAEQVGQAIARLRLALRHAHSSA
jgi:hypothetical protein